MSRLTQITAAVLLLTQAACTTVRVVSPEYIAAQTPGRIWVTPADQNTELLVFQPRINADTLFGLVSPTEEFMLPVVSVREVKAKRLDPMKTTLFSLGVAAIATTLGIIAFNAAGRGEGCPIPPGQIMHQC